MTYNTGDVVHISATGLLHKPRGYGVITVPSEGFFFFINSPKGKGRYFYSYQYKVKNYCYMIKKDAYPKLPGDSCISCRRHKQIGWYSPKHKKPLNRVTGKVRYSLNFDDLKGLRDHILSQPRVSKRRKGLYERSFNERIKELESASIH